MDDEYQRLVKETLAFTRKGVGIPVVFLHAFPLSRSMWEGDVEFFSRNFQPIAPDLPGFGDSPLAGMQTSMEATAEAVKKLLDEVCPQEKIVLCGLSMGGYIAFEFMRKYGSLVRALVLAATRATPDTPEAQANRIKMAELVKSKGTVAVAEIMVPKLLGPTTLAEQPQTVQRVRDMIAGNRPEGVAAALLGMAARRDSTESLQDIKCPALVIIGEEDTVIKVEEAQVLKEKLPVSKLEVILKAGHLVNIEQPREFDRVFINFLKAKVL